MEYLWQRLNAFGKAALGDPTNGDGHKEEPLKDIAEPVNAVRDDSDKQLNRWQRLIALYRTDEVCFETSVVQTAMQYTFAVTAFLCGASQWRSVAERYERYAMSGRIYLSPVDSVRRRTDYAFAAFLRRGFIAGSFTAIYVGCIVAVITHATVWRGNFSLWIVPTASTLVPMLCALPFGTCVTYRGMLLGLLSGLTVASFLYGLASYRSITVSELYQEFKDYQCKKLRSRKEYEKRILAYQNDHHIPLKFLARIRMKQDELCGEGFDETVTRSEPES